MITEAEAGWSDYVDSFAAHHLAIAGIVLVSLVFLAGLTDFKDSRPTGGTWFWWGWGSIGVTGFIGFALRTGHVGAAAATCSYTLLLTVLTWRRMSRLRPKGTDGAFS